MAVVGDALQGASQNRDLERPILTSAGLGLAESSALPILGSSALSEPCPNQLCRDLGLVPRLPGLVPPIGGAWVSSTPLPMDLELGAPGQGEPAGLWSSSLMCLVLQPWLTCRSKGMILAECRKSPVFKSCKSPVLPFAIRARLAVPLRASLNPAWHPAAPRQVQRAPALCLHTRENAAPEGTC